VKRGPLAAQTRTEVVLTLRRGESVLLTLGIPVLLLVFLSLADVLPLPTGVDDPVDFLFPGIRAPAELSAALDGPAIATGFEREYGVLKRLGVTPLGRPAIITDKTIAVLVVELVQVVVLTGIALALGWRPDGALVGTALLGVALATVAFAGAGLLLGGTLPGLTTLAAANGLYVILLLIGGMVFPLDSLPGGVRDAARLLPSAALAEVLQHALRHGAALGAEPWIVLVAWAVVLPPLAARCFKWR
jgi:ABC-2 type transport system permease protein